MRPTNFLKIENKSFSILNFNLCSLFILSTTCLVSGTKEIDFIFFPFQSKIAAEISYKIFMQRNIAIWWVENCSTNQCSIVLNQYYWYIQMFESQLVFISWVCEFWMFAAHLLLHLFHWAVARYQHLQNQTIRAIIAAVCGAAVFDNRSSFVLLLFLFKKKTFFIADWTYTN